MMPNCLKECRRSTLPAIILIMISVIGFFLISSVAEGKIITVDDSGGKDYTTIQEAIDNAETNDTIEVYNGTYIENLKVDKPVKIISKYGPNETYIVTKDDTDHAVEIQSDYVEVRGFNVSQAYGDLFGAAAFYMDGITHCVLKGNMVYDNAYGVQMTGSTDNEFLENTFLSNRDWCVFNAQLSCDRNIVRGNIFEYNYDNAIYFGSSSYNTIEENFIRLVHSEGFERNGIFLDHQSNFNNVWDNCIEHHRIGILLNDGCDNNDIRNNELKDNDDYGIALDNMFSEFGETGNDHNTLEGNQFSNNGGHDFFSFDSRDNFIRDHVHLGKFTLKVGVRWETDIGLDSTKEAPETDPDGWKNIEKYFDVTTYKEGGFINLTLGYKESELDDVEESSLKLWFFTGGTWEEIVDSIVDTEKQEVTGNMTPRNGTVAIMGKMSMGPPIWNGDTDESFQKLQDAIDDPDTIDGHSIYIGNGVVNENIVIDKKLTIIGNGSENTQIQGDPDNPIIKIDANGVTYKNFKVYGGLWGLDVNADGTTISGCDISGSKEGGISVFDIKWLTIDTCDIYQNDGPGVMVNTSTTVNITNCTIRDNLRSGIRLVAVLKAQLRDCDISSNGRDGIEARESDELTILRLKLERNIRNGLLLEFSDRLQLRESTIRENGRHGVSLNEVKDSDIRTSELERNLENAIDARIIKDTRRAFLRLIANIENGLYLFDSEGVYIEDCEANNNSKNGIQLEDDNICPISNSSTRTNGQHGVSVNNSGTINITTCQSENNTGDGFWSSVTKALKMVTTETSGNKGNGLTLEDMQMELGDVTSDIDIKSWNNARDGVHIDGAKGFLQDVIVKIGTDASGNGGHAFVIMNSGNLRVWNSKLTSNGMNGLLIRNSNDIAIEELQIEDNEGLGIEIENSNNVQMESVQIQKCGGPGIGMKDSELIGINECFIDEMFDDGIIINRSMEIDLKNCTIKESKGLGVRIEYSNNVDIRDSTIERNAGGGLSLWYSNFVDILNDVFGWNGEAGMILDTTDWTNITNSKVENNTKDGIRIESSRNLTVKNSRVNQNGENGLFLNHSELIDLTNLSASENNKTGIHAAIVDLLRLQECTVLDNSASGIILEHVENAIIMNSNIRAKLNTAIGMTINDTRRIEMINSVFESSGKEGMRITNSQNISITKGTTIKIEEESTGPGVIIEHSHDIKVFDATWLFGMNVTEIIRFQESYEFYSNNLSFLSEGKRLLMVRFDAGDEIIRMIMENATLETTDEKSRVVVEVDGDGSVFEMTNALFKCIDTRVSFVLGKGGRVSGVLTEEAPANPDGMGNVSSYLNVTGNHAESWFDAQFHYQESDLGNVIESTLQLYHFSDAGAWELVPGSGVNIDENYVYGNVTDFSIIAPLGDLAVNSVPVILITSPANGSQASDTITVTGTATDGNGDHNVQKVEIQVDDGTWQVATGTVNWTFSLDTSSLENGGHTIRVRAFDQESTSAEVVLTIDVLNSVVQNIKPTVIILSPEDKAEVSETITISGNATDEDGVIERVEISIDGGDWITIEEIDSWNFEWDSTTVDDGDHTVRVRAFDGTDYSDVVPLTLSVSNEDDGDGEGFIPFPGVAVFLLSVMVAAGICGKRRRS